MAQFFSSTATRWKLLECRPTVIFTGLSKPQANAHDNPVSKDLHRCHSLSLACRQGSTTKSEAKKGIQEAGYQAFTLYKWFVLRHWQWRQMHFQTAGELYKFYNVQLLCNIAYFVLFIALVLASLNDYWRSYFLLFEASHWSNSSGFFCQYFNVIHFKGIFLG